MYKLIIKMYKYFDTYYFQYDTQLFLYTSYYLNIIILKVSLFINAWNTHCQNITNIIFLNIN